MGVTPVLAKREVIYTTLEEYEEVTGKKIVEFNEAPMLKEKNLVAKREVMILISYTL